MTVHEPITVASDWLLTAVSLVFAIRLWRPASRAWSLMFLFTAAGSLFGGAFHGLGLEKGEVASAALWKATMLTIGLASFFLLVAAVAHRLAPLFAVLMFVAYASWSIGHSSFLWVIIDYGLAYLAVAVVHLVLWMRLRSEGSAWIVGSFVVSVLAAVIQQSALAIGPANHNDVYHVVQLAALSLLFRGATLMTRAKAQSTIQPR